MDWLKIFTQKVGAVLKPKTTSKEQVSLPAENIKKPNIVVSGCVDRFNPVLIRRGDRMHNCHVLIFKGEDKIIFFEEEIVSNGTQVGISLLRPGDYVQCEINPQGAGVLSTIKSNAWRKLTYREYHDSDAPQDNTKKPVLRVIRGGKT